MQPIGVVVVCHSRISFAWTWQVTKKESMKFATQKSELDEEFDEQYRIEKIET